MKLLLCMLVLAITIIGCKDKTPQKLQKIRLLHTNDHHGHYLQDEHGQYGMAARKTLIDRLRAEIKQDGGSSLLLSGGDINTGTMESDIFNAKPDFLGMKKIGYDAMAVGNHEFDNDFDVLKSQMKWAGFPFLSANIYHLETDKRVFQPSYIIKNLQGVKVGIFGLTTVDTPFKASHDDAKKLFEFRPIIESAKIVVKELREKEKVDLIIVLTHIGHHGSATSNGDLDLAQAVPEIDVVVGGHSQEIINAEQIGKTIIVQAKDWGKYVGVLDLNLNDKNERVDFTYKLIPVNLKKKVDGKRVYIEKEITENQELVELFSEYKKEAEIIGRKVVGELDLDLTGERKLVRSSQVSVGQMMGAALRYQVKGVDLAVLNGGSIRSGLSAGKISRKDIHNVHPYGNTISTVNFTAVELFNYMSVIAKYAIVDKHNLIGGYPQVINAKLTLKSGELQSITSLDGKWTISKSNKTITSNKKTFLLGTMNFLGKGGDNYPKISKHKTYVDSGFMINAAMMNMIESKKKIKMNHYEALTKGIFTFKE